MNKPTVYIDGQEGTTGLRIREMLGPRDDVEVLLIPGQQRKDPAVRAQYLNRADLCVLCLPDDAAAEALELIENPRTRVIDTSTARRTAAAQRAAQGANRDCAKSSFDCLRISQPRPRGTQKE